MVLAGWLRSYGFMAGVGYGLAWSADGAQKALLLEDLSIRFELTSMKEGPVDFHRSCKEMILAGDRFVPPTEIAVASFWLTCISELGLDDDLEGQHALIDLVTRFGPDAKESIQDEGAAVIRQGSV